jgi:hypothetical protein
MEHEGKLANGLKSPKGVEREIRNFIATDQRNQDNPGRKPMSDRTYAQQVNELGEALGQLPQVRSYENTRGDTEREPEAYVLARALVDISESVRRLATEQFPALAREPSAEQLGDVIHEVREELRHILYHVRDSAYLRVIE